MRNTTRDLESINGGQGYKFKDVEKEALRAMYCLCHNAAKEEPNEAMKSTQAALNIANAVATLRTAYRERS
jgi:hypothetical protein